MRLIPVEESLMIYVEDLVQASSSYFFVIVNNISQTSDPDTATTTITQPGVTYFTDSLRHVDANIL